MSQIGATAERIRRALTSVLPPGLSAGVVPLGEAPGRFGLTVAAGEVTHRFTSGWAGAGWPGDVGNLLVGAPPPDVVFARHLSEGARAALADRRIGWVDESGQANISLRSGLVIVREPQRRDAPRDVSDRWTPTMLSAAEAILAGTPPTVEAVQAATGMSRGGAAKAMARLERRGRLSRPAKRGRGVARRVDDLDAFLDDYAAAAAVWRARQPPVRLHRLMNDPLDLVANEVGPKLTAAGATWAVSGAAASTLLAPYLSHVAVLELYIDPRHFDHGLAGVIGAREVARGHVIELRESPTPLSTYGPRVDGVQVALPARVYADLVAAGGRSEEAAHHLREVRGVGPESQ